MCLWSFETGSSCAHQFARRCPRARKSRTGLIETENLARAIHICILTNSGVYKNKSKLPSVFKWRRRQQRCSGGNLRLTFDHFAANVDIFWANASQLGYDNRVPIRHNSILITFSLINMLIILHSNYWEQSSESLCRFDVTIDMNSVSYSARWILEQNVNIYVLLLAAILTY